MQNHQHLGSSNSKNPQLYDRVQTTNGGGSLIIPSTSTAQQFQSVSAHGNKSSHAATNSSYNMHRQNATREDSNLSASAANSNSAQMNIYQSRSQPQSVNNSQVGAQGGKNSQAIAQQMIMNSKHQGQFKFSSQALASKQSYLAQHSQSNQPHHQQQHANFVGAGLVGQMNVSNQSGNDTPSDLFSNLNRVSSKTSLSMRPVQQSQNSQPNQAFYQSSHPNQGQPTYVIHQQYQSLQATGQQINQQNDPHGSNSKRKSVSHLKPSQSVSHQLGKNTPHLTNQLPNSESNNKLRRISNLKPNSQVYQEDKKKEKRNHGLMLANSQQHHGAKQTVPISQHLANTHFITSQSERTATTDIEAKSAALMNTQRNVMSNAASSINTNATKIGSSGANAQCSTERFSEELRYKHSQKQLQAPSSDTGSQQTIQAQSQKNNQTMRLKDNQGVFIEKRMTGHNVNEDGTMFGLELDHVQVKTGPGQQMSAGKNMAKREKQELGILQENKQNLLYNMNDYEFSKTTKAQSIVCPIYQSKDFRLISNNKQQAAQKVRMSNNVQQQKHIRDQGQVQVKRSDRNVRAVRGSSRESQVRSISNDKHEDVYMTKNVMGKNRKKTLKTSSMSDSKSDIHNSKQSNQKSAGKRHNESSKNVDSQIESSGSAIDIDKFINQYLESSNNKVQVNQNHSNASGDQPLADKLLYLTNQAHQTKIKSKSQLTASVSSQNQIRKKMTSPNGVTGSQSTLQEPSAKALPASSNMKISRKFNKFEQTQGVKVHSTKQNLFQINKTTKKTHNASLQKSDHDHSSSQHNKSNTNSHAVLPRKLVQNEIKQLTKKLKSPSPQVKFTFERIGSPDPDSQGPKDGLKKGHVLEKRRLSQKRISELSHAFNTNQSNAKMTISKGSISANNSLSKTKRHSIDNANAVGVGSDEARQLYCRIDSRKNSQSSLHNAQGMIHGLSQVQILQVDGNSAYNKISPDQLYIKKGTLSPDGHIKNSTQQFKQVHVKQQKEHSKEKEKGEGNHFKIKPAGFLSQSPKAKKAPKGIQSMQQLLNASGNSNNGSSQGKITIGSNIKQPQKFVQQMQTAYKSANIDPVTIASNLKYQQSISPVQKSLMQITAPKPINVQSPPSRIMVKASSPRTSPNPSKQIRKQAVQTCKVSIEMPQAVQIAKNIQTTKSRPTSKDIIKQIKMAKRIASNSPTPLASSGQNSPRGISGHALPLRVYEGGKKYIPMDTANRQPSPQSNAESSNSKRLTKVSKSKTMKILSALSSPNQLKSSGGNKSPKGTVEFAVNSNSNSQRQNRESQQLQKLIQNSMKSPMQREKNSTEVNQVNSSDPNFSGEIQLNINFTGQLNMSVKAQQKQQLQIMKMKQSIGGPQTVKNSASQGNLMTGSQLANFASQQHQKNPLKKSQVVVASQLEDQNRYSGNPNAQSVGLFKKPHGLGHSAKYNTSKHQTPSASLIGQANYGNNTPFQETDSMPIVQEIMYDEDGGNFIDMHQIELEEIALNNATEKQSIVILQPNVHSQKASAAMKKEREKISNSGVMVRSDIVPPQLNHQAAGKQCKKQSNRQSLIKDKDMKKHLHKNHKVCAKSNMIENKAYQDGNSKDIFRPGHEFSDSIKATSIPPDNSESISSENLLRRSVMVGGGNNVTQISNEHNREQAIYNRDLVKLCKMIRLHFKQFQTAPPTTSEFYRIGRVLGKGAFGKVSLAMHKLSEQLVAIKSMSKEDLQSEEDLKRRTKLEMGILKQCNQTNVVKLYDTFETQKHICFVIELCSGGDLFSYIKKRRRLKENVAQFFFKQIIEGLAYIHNAKKVVHRDIKLENILLDATGNVKICDFGVSRQLQTGEEQMMQQCGTPAYIAPEILKDQGYYGFKVDMWSAGVCLYAMLIGSVPFKASTMSALQNLILNGKYDFKFQTNANSNKLNNPKAATSLLSEGVQDLIAKLLTVDPNKRLSAIQALEHPWLKNAPVDFDVYTDKEKQLIQKEYLRLNLKKSSHQRLDSAAAHSNCSRRQQTTHSAVHETEMLFTEHNLETKLGEDEANQGNQEEKSYILAPFNSIKSMFIENGNQVIEPKKDDPPYEWPKEITDLIVARKCIRFSNKCREKNRVYEQNNNADLDNGVYNEFVNEQEREEGALLKGSLKGDDDSDNIEERSPQGSPTGEKKSIPSIESSEGEDDSQSEDSLQKSFRETELSSDDEKAEKQLNEAHKQWTDQRQNEQAIDMCNNSAEQIEANPNKNAAVTAQQKQASAPRCSPAIPAAQAAAQKKPATVKPGSQQVQAHSPTPQVQYVEPEFVIDYGVVSQIQKMGIIPEWYLLAELQTLTNQGGQGHNQQLPPMHRRSKPQPPQMVFESKNNQGENARRMNYVTAAYFLLCKRKELQQLHEKQSSVKNKEYDYSDEDD